MPWLMLTFGFADGKTLALCALRGLERPREGRMPRDARHFAFACAGDAELSAWKQRLRAANVSFWEEDHGTQRSIYFEDPNGIVLEVTTPARPALPDPSAERVLRAWLSESASQ